jgi:Ca2+-binding EF-hand superfamily protein
VIDATGTNPAAEEQGELIVNRKILFGALAGLTLLAASVQAQRPGRSFGGPPPFAHADANGDKVVTSAEWQALFATLDADHNGKLVASELPDGPPRGPGALAYVLARGADANGDGKVPLAEYKARIAKLDADGDGALSLRELSLHPRGGRTSDNPPPFVDEADTDQDGELSVDELETVFHSADEDDDGILLVHGPRGRR